MILAIVESIQKNYSKKKKKRLVLFAYFLQIFLYDQKNYLTLCPANDVSTYGSTKSWTSPVKAFFTFAINPEFTV